MARMLRTDENTIKVISPAKVNLFLAVGEKGKGVQCGMHPVINILHSLLLHDILYFNYKKTPGKSLNIQIEFIESQNIDLRIPNISLHDNLIYKAITSLATKMPNKSNYEIKVYVEKNIPAGAGLAGGSSNAASALLAAAKIFNIAAESKEVLETAKEIGADVAFFLQGGCALYKGAGEILDHKISPMNRELLLVKPMEQDEKSSISTKEAYGVFDRLNCAANLDEKFSLHAFDHNHHHNKDCQNKHDHENEKMNLHEATEEIVCADNVPLFNNLAYASEEIMPQLKDIKSWLGKKVGVNNVLLSGSGSATFAIVPDEIDGEKLAEEARSKGFWSQLTQLANTKARIIPIINEV